MTDRVPCPHCEKIRDVELVEREEQVTIEGREVAFRAQLSRCTTCGEEFEAPGQLDANLTSAREAYARLYQIPTPAQLVKLRSRYGASQKVFGLILGFGELTMNTYEQGGVPDPSNRLLLKLAENPVFFKAMYDQNNARIGATQRRCVESSAGFQAAESWKGMEALAVALTPAEQAKVQTCAARYHQTVLQQVCGYVRAASIQDYAQLLVDATWPGGTTMVPEESKGASMDSLQAAS